MGEIEGFSDIVSWQGHGRVESSKREHLLSRALFIVTLNNSIERFSRIHRLPISTILATRPKLRGPPHPQSEAPCLAIQPLTYESALEDTLCIIISSNKLH
jgi:hypothetical protein